jgi:NAD dependent epimerase/dehydratase family enzyme
VFGPGEAGNFTRLAHSLKAGYFFYPGRSDTIKACGFVEDLIRSLIFMDERGPGTHLYNYAYPDPYTVRDICNAFMRVGGFSAATPTVPHRLLLMASYITEIANSIGLRNDINRARVSKLLRSTNIVPEALTKAGFRFETNLESALRTWRAAEPAGSFV